MNLMSVIMFIYIYTHCAGIPDYRITKRQSCGLTGLQRLQVITSTPKPLYLEMKLVSI